MVREFNVLPSGGYCGYLRKSRADLEAEARGEEETYARHTRTLLELAKRYSINLTKIYTEKPISGERISARPEMLQLLEDIEAGQWKGVLVVEVERLARGDTMDQGIVAQTFKFSETLIITPQRLYDPNNPDDEEYFEFGLFMSRREFKTTTRRLQRGRVDSVKDGKYIGNKPPYGYNRIKNPIGKGYTLEPHPDQAPIVQLIFSMYTNPDPEQRKGTGLIAAYLNHELQVPTARNSKWTVATINGIIRNPVYIGKLRWGFRPQIKRRTGKSRPRKSEGQWLETKGLHPPIVEEETYQLANQIMQENSHAPAPAGKISNPMAGIVKCAVCDAAIIYRPYSGRNNKTPPTLICSTQYCKNKSSYFHLVEERLLKALEDWLSAYMAEWEGSRPKRDRNEEAKIKALQKMVQNQNKRLNELTEQKNNLHDLVERKVYTIEMFLERSQLISKQIEEVKTAIAQSEKELEDENKRMTARVETIPKVKYVLEMYHQAESPAAKNALLKSVVEKVVYRKDVGGRWSGAIDQFELVLFPKLAKG